VEGFRSLMADLPQNTIGVYSYSNCFDATGWRLGVVAVHQDNIFDRMIARLPDVDMHALNKRYSSLTLEPERMKFIDRMVADSRHVALNHTAGLSLPQQTQMTLFSLFGLTDKENAYKHLTRGILRQRYQDFWKGFHAVPPDDDLRAGYYSIVDILIGAEQRVGQDFSDYMMANYEPIDVLVQLAEQYGTVLLNGSGFDAPLWSVRCALANLPDADYQPIGDQLEAMVKQYAEA
jgi:aspartate 4-decarboxylase